MIMWDLKFALACLLSSILYSVNSVASDNSKITEKRIILHSDEDIAEAFQNLSRQVHTLQNKMSAVEGELASTKHELTNAYTELAATNQKLTDATNQIQMKAGQGSTYIRWGRTVCPGNQTERVYKGFAGGAFYSSTGGAADYICLTEDVIWGEYDDAHQSHAALMYGVEYEFGEDFSDGGARFFGQDSYQHDVPCALCRTHRPTTVMIPGRNQCYAGWTLEYSGYLVSGREDDPSASNYICLDVRPETQYGDNRNDNGKLLIFVEAICGSLRCPPYEAHRELTCVVCSK